MLHMDDMDGDAMVMPPAPIPRNTMTDPSKNSAVCQYESKQPEEDPGGGAYQKLGSDGTDPETDNQTESDKEDLLHRIARRRFGKRFRFLNLRNIRLPNPLKRVGASRLLFPFSSSLYVGSGLTPHEFIRSSSAWHLALCFACTASPGMFIAGTFKVYGESKFSSEEFLSIVSETSSLCNALGRILVGYIADKFGILRSLQALTIINSIVTLTYPLSSRIGQPGFVLWTFLIFLCEGGNFALYPAINALVFGARHASVNYGMLFLLYSLTCVANITLLSRVGVEFSVATTVCAVLLLFGFLNLLWFEYRQIAYKSSVTQDR